jgi:peptidoglycan hydrolase-like protein with peptidoglycan-binding domain
VSASPAGGTAPLAVTLTADADAHWDFGDGTSADGAIVTHTYGAGSWTATATAAGESASVHVDAGSVTLTGPRGSGYGRPVVLRGVAVPGGVPVAVYTTSRELAVTRARADGSFRVVLPHLTGAGPYVARTLLAGSAPLSIGVRPELRVAFTGAGAVGRPLALSAALRPATAGKLRVRIWRSGRLVADLRRTRGVLRLSLPTGKAAAYRAEIATVPAAGYVAARSAAERTVVDPNLQLGSSGPSVRALEQRLAAMHYALQRVDGRFDSDTYEAVLAFQKVHGLARTGRVDLPLWQRIATASTPAARYPGDHVEVDKARQVLFEVRRGKVALVVHVSTGATGNTPIGTWQVYRRVPGFDWVLYYPTYFTGAFAIHGYPSVPAYPASHGCVRVPMWIATRLYEMDQQGARVYVYA